MKTKPKNRTATTALKPKPAFELKIERLVNAPRERVFEAWTKPELIKPWFAPQPYQLQVQQMDFRPGGRFHMSMRAPDGSKHSFSGTYREINPPSKLTWTGEFSTGPADQMTTIVTFKEQGQKTKVQAVQTFHVMTPEIKGATEGAKQGWTMTLDQLDAFCSASGGPNDRIEKSAEYKASVSRVWRALTDYREFGEWFKVKLEKPFAAGQKAIGHITYPGYEHLKWEAMVKDVQPERLFSFTWHPYAIDPSKDYSQESPTLVEFRLQDSPSGSRLTLSETGFEKIPSERQADAFRMNDHGWAEQLKNIENYLAKDHDSH